MTSSSSAEPRRSFSSSLGRARSFSSSLGRARSLCLRPPATTSTESRPESHPPAPESQWRGSKLGLNLCQLVGKLRPGDLLNHHRPEVLVGPQLLPRSLLDRPLPDLPPPDTPPPAYSESERQRRRRERRERRDRPPAYDRPGVIIPKGLGLDLDFDIDEGERLARHLERDRRSVDL